MVSIYIVAAEAAAGKTAICAGLARNWLNEGKKVGYRRLPLPGSDGTSSDVAFMQHLIGQEQATASGDIVLIEANIGATASDELSRNISREVKEKKARAIAVAGAAGASPEFFNVCRGLGNSLLGIILNKVPQGHLAHVRSEAAARSEAVGIKLLGVIPENRKLLAMTVGELAECLEGTILNNNDRSADLVENFMLGAMVVGSGVDYFQRKSGKAAIIHRNRPDMQLAALETPTSCLVLTGGHEPPFHHVLQKARDRGIPVITTGLGTGDVISRIEGRISGGRMNQEKKVPILAELVKNSLDLKTLILAS